MRGASTQGCFIDQAQDGRKPVNMGMNNGLDMVGGQRSAGAIRGILEVMNGGAGVFLQIRKSVLGEEREKWRSVCFPLRPGAET